MISFTANPKYFRNNKQKKLRLIARVGMPSLVLASLAFAVVTRWQEMGRDVKISKFLRWLKVSQRQILTFSPGSLICNNNRSPDWSRIGIDITLRGPFNATFSLSDETDADGDGVGDSLDQCAGTSPGAIVDANGSSTDQLAPRSGPAFGGSWKNHGENTSAVAFVAKEFLAQGLISEDQKDAIVAQAAESSCGAKSMQGTNTITAVLTPRCAQ